MPPQDIKIPYAERGGELVHISAFEKGGLKPDCLCLVCRTPLVARVGRLRVPHFAHLPDVQPCSLETVLHQLGKRLLALRIRQALEERAPLRLRWGCDECGERYHTRDALKDVASFTLEQPIGPVRPDLALFRQDGVPAAVFEIIVTHPPEPEALDFYREQGIKVWQLTLHTVEEAERLAQPGTVLRVEAAAAYCPLPPLPCCPDPFCHRYGERMTFRYFRVPLVPCWSCGHPMPAAFVRHGVWDGYGGRELGPEAFSEEELTRARAEGVHLVQRRSHGTGKPVWANACQRCRSHIGTAFYRHYAEALEKCKPLARTGYGCGSCETHYLIGSGPAPAPVPACSQCAQPLTARYLFVFEWRDQDGFHSTMSVVRFGRHRGRTVGPLDFTLEELTTAARRGANERGHRIKEFFQTAGEQIGRRSPCLSSWWCQHCGCVDQSAGRLSLEDRREES